MLPKNRKPEKLSLALHKVGALHTAANEAVLTVAARCGVPLISAPEQAELVLCQIDDLLALAWGSDLRASVVPFSTDVAPASGRDPLLRAMGGQGLRVMDATAGWAEDAARLAYGGHQVTAVERLCLIHEITAYNWEARENQVISGQLDLVFVDAVSWLAASQREAFDVVYLDPMFPAKKRASAATKKPLQLLQALSDEPGDAEAEQLLCLARKVAGKRVVVKRGLKAPWLAGVQPSGSVNGKLIRFDLYPPEEDNG